MSTTATPRLTIGLPVFNGERFLARALDSLLGQDFADFVLLVSDNASTDATPDILADYAVRDGRVRVVRQQRNLGASPNWCWVAREADTELFTWAACDDEYAPTFLSRCIALLDADPGLVLAYTGTVDIDEDGRRLREWDEFFQLDHPDPAVRFRELVSRDHMCFQLFGVVRTPVLQSTALLGPFPDADRVTLAELALRGRFGSVRDPLFLHREHEGRSVNVHPASRDRLAWFDTSNVKTRAFPAWRLGRELAAAAQRAPLPAADTARVLLEMRVWLRFSRARLVRNVVRSAVDEVRGRHRSDPLPRARSQAPPVSHAAAGVRAAAGVQDPHDDQERTT